MFLRKLYENFHNNLTRIRKKGKKLEKKSRFDPGQNSGF